MATSGSHSTAKRLVLFRNGTSHDGKLITLPDTLEDLLECASHKFAMEFERVFAVHGGEVDDLSVLRDNDIVYLSAGEPFISPSLTKSASAQAMPILTQECDVPAFNTAEWVTLNVGGKYFTTTRSTLTKEPASMLSCMFSRGDAPHWCSSIDANGAFLIDRSPTYFEPILNYLRHGELVLDKGINPQGVLEEAKFFGIEPLIELLETRVHDNEIPGDNTPITRREFILRLMNTPTNCELRCQGLNFTGADLSKLDLRYVNFKYAVLRRVNMSGANLAYCNFERADMSEAKLDSAILLGAKMLCVNLERASLQGCNFEDPAGSRTNMEGANMKYVNLEDSHMSGVNLRVATLKNANLQNCDLRSAVLAGADLENCDLSGCDLQEANLRGANLKGATFELMLNPLHMSQTVP